MFAVRVSPVALKVAVTLRSGHNGIGFIRDGTLNRAGCGGLTEQVSATERE